MLPINKVKEILLRYEVFECSLSQSDIDKNTFVKNSKEYASIGDIIDDVKLYIKIINDQKSSEKILEDKSAEKELREMAEQELNEIKNKIVDLENKIKMDVLIEKIFFAHKKLAKHQRTWIKKIPNLKAFQSVDTAKDEIMEYLSH